jgi:indole-3-glycerol phosphate synthase
MNKFYAYVISSSLVIKRVWMSNSDVISALTEHKDITIMRDSQQAVLIGEDLMWRDIKPQDAL